MASGISTKTNPALWEKAKAEAKDKKTIVKK